MKNNKIGKKILAAFLIASLSLSNQSFGVFAQEEDVQVEEDQGKVDNDNDAGQEEKDSESNEATEDVSNENEEESNENGKVENKPSEESTKDDEEIDTQSEEEKLSNEDVITKLIDADIALLKWKATKTSTVTVEVGENNYTVFNDITYQKAYSDVCNAMEKVATIFSSNDINIEDIQKNAVLKEINSQTITSDTIWKVSGNVSMNGTITVDPTGRLVILGDGKIQRKGFDFGNDSSIDLKGKICLQDSVAFDGGNERFDARFLKADKDNNVSGVKPEVYLTDNFKIQNIVINDKNGAGIYANNADVYMSGGMIGSDEISFTWDDQQTTQYGNTTEIYLRNREENNEYPYLKSITSAYGCVSKSINENGGTRGAGIAMYSSSFEMSGGNIVGNTLLGTAIGNGNNSKGCHGAGAYFFGCQVNITGGKISGNQSNTTSEAKKYYDQYAGAIQLEGPGICNLTNVEISYNYAQRWVGAIDIYPNSKLTMNEGTIIKYNCAESNCGGIAVDGKDVEMVMNGGKLVHNYSGGLGGGIRCLGKLTMNSGEICYNSSKGNAAGLSVQSDVSRRGNAILNGGTIHHNKSASNGGGMGIVTGYQGEISQLVLDGTEVYANKAANNGGGFYVDARDGTVNVELKKGNIHDNQAANGGGVYINQENDCIATLRMTSYEMIVEENSASVKGGGIYLNHNEKTGIGSISAIIQDGYIRRNFANQSGGGAYLSGGSLTIDGGIFENNQAVDGAGAYVADGKLYMFGGNVSSNVATNNGGGFYVSSDNKAADVVIRSGIISNNKAGKSGEKAGKSGEKSGGAIAVVSTNNNEDKVVVGLLEEHKGLDFSDRTFNSFEYKDDLDNKAHTHSSCPKIEGNTAEGDGGGIYMSSSQSTLDIYCLLENNNTSSKNNDGGSIMSVGGNVNIGDKDNNTENAKGNIFIRSPMLVEGGNVVLNGNAENPKFAEKILVDIQKNAGTFKDNRLANITDDANYIIEYFENYEGSGAYVSNQYKETDTIQAPAAIFPRVGKKIVGWDTQQDGKGTRYKIGEPIGQKDDHTAWPNGKYTLILYAQWELIGYTVEFNSNSTSTVTGSMEKQTFKYGEKKVLSSNQFKIAGKRFIGWKDSNGKEYEADYNESKMTEKDGDTVNLYAQWEDCKHEAEHLSYSLSGDNTIIEKCDCEGHTVSVNITGAKTYYADGNEHLASLSCPDNLIAEKPTITYSYRKDESSDYQSISTKPKEVGYYKASIQLGGKTAFVEYEIKSPAEAATIDVSANSGEYFEGFRGVENCEVSEDDAFTIQFDVNGLNKGSNDMNKPYTSAPILTFDKALPTGATIIMQASKEYYWYKIDNNNIYSVSTTSFTKMGSMDPFSYTVSDSQNYRFIIDFSKVKDGYLSDGLKVGLKYEDQTGAKNDKEGKKTIKLTSKSAFTITNNNNVYTITVPKAESYTRWYNKNLVWKISSAATSKFPSDATLTMVITENGQTQTTTCSLNQKGEFIIPFKWSQNSNVQFTLHSQQESMEGKYESLQADLCVGNKERSSIEDGFVQVTDSSLNLNMSKEQKPSLKISISGTSKVLSRNESLDVEIESQNTDGYQVRANIQKKDENGSYGGNYIEKEITPGKAYNKKSYVFGLGTLQDAGSYRLLVRVLNNSNQTVLEVPYYFVVK